MRPLLRLILRTASPGSRLAAMLCLRLYIVGMITSSSAAWRGAIGGRRA
jgi:hypothetical protein